ncbi:hypothetical protein Tco_1179805, partial [Tanacetum coccineum]
PVSTPLDTCEKLMPNRDLAVSQLEYSRVIGYLMYAMTCTRPDIAFVVGKLMLEGYTDASWITNTEDNSSTSGWLFLLSATGKEAEWLKNLLLEIPLWVKPMTPISIRCDNAATLAKAYSQMYNGKSRHLGVRHSMIHELITNGVVSIEFVRSQQNLVDHLMKGLARDLVLKSVQYGKLNIQRAEAQVLQIIPGMCLEPAERRMKYGVYTQRSLDNLTQIVVKGILVADELQLVNSSGTEGYHQRVIHQRKYPQRVSSSVSIEPSAGMLLSGQADASGH